MFKQFSQALLSVPAEGRPDSWAITKEIAVLRWNVKGTQRINVPNCGQINGNKCPKWVRVDPKWLPEFQGFWPGHSGTLI